MTVPDPYYDEQADRQAVRRTFIAQWQLFCTKLGKLSDAAFLKKYGAGIGIPGKPVIRQMLTFMYNFADSAEEVEDLIGSVIHVYDVGAGIAEHVKAKGETKQLKQLWEEMLEQYELSAFDAATKDIVMIALLAKTLENLTQQWSSGDVAARGFDVGKALVAASVYIDEHPQWLSSEKPVGPRKFFQQHVAQVMEANPELELEKTPRSGDIKLTLNDRWRLDDLGIKDKFLDAYIGFNHCQKLLSTYMNPVYVKADSRVHSRFTNYKRTGRTSCSSPNVQNYPSRDKVFPQKNMFAPYDGMILCATDFSFIELCAFAQTCYSRFGVSVMRDVINAGLDPHRWFAGVMEKLITPDLSHKDDPKWVCEMKQFLKENVPDEVRQKAKMWQPSFEE